MAAPLGSCCMPCLALRMLPCGPLVWSLKRTGRACRPPSYPVRCTAGPACSRERMLEPLLPALLPCRPPSYLVRLADGNYVDTTDDRLVQARACTARYQARAASFCCAALLVRGTYLSMFRSCMMLETRTAPTCAPLAPCGAAERAQAQVGGSRPVPLWSGWLWHSRSRRRRRRLPTRPACSACSAAACACPRSTARSTASGTGRASGGAGGRRAGGGQAAAACGWLPAGASGDHRGLQAHQVGHQRTAV